jgi:hypothetical protein
MISLIRLDLLPNHIGDRRFGDAKDHRSTFIIASPDRERATGADLLQQVGAESAYRQAFERIRL